MTGSRIGPGSAQAPRGIMNGMPSRSGGRAAAATRGAVRPNGTRPGEKLNEIVDTAARLFADRGFAATSMAEICDAVGLQRGALYYYIGSKENCLELIHDRVMDEAMPSARQVQELDAPPIERLRLLGEHLMELNARFPDHSAVFHQDASAFTGERRAHFRRRRAEYRNVVRQVMSDVLAANGLADTDLRTLVFGWLTMHTGSYVLFGRPDPPEPLRIARTYHQIFAGGFAGMAQR